MLEYNRIDISEGIDVDKTNASKKYKIYHYWYLLDKNFSYGPYPCNGCYNIMQNRWILKTLILFMLKEVHTEFTFGI